MLYDSNIYNLFFVDVIYLNKHILFTDIFLGTFEIMVATTSLLHRLIGYTLLLSRQLTSVDSDGPYGLCIAVELCLWSNGLRSIIAIF